MCDTFGALPSWTGTGTALFGKNSDREPDEAQLIVVEPRRICRAGDTLKCTYISIPQVRVTHAVLLSRPFWMWGAEMGVNEKGVAIGNEAIFTKIKPEKGLGLIGMDLVRLALERADSARLAAEVICGLLAQFGQAGPCGYRDKRMTYMNSFLIMDAREILVLETLGRDYALKSYGDHAAISNAISLDTDWEASSMKPGTNLKKMVDPLITYFAGGRYRRLCSMERIMGACGRMDIQDAFAILRSHNDLSGFNRDVCMHAQGRLIRKSQTTGSLVVALNGQNRFKIFVTAGMAPCLTPFKPVLPAHLPMDIGMGGDRYNEESYWWRHARFHVLSMSPDAMARHDFQSEILVMEQRYSDLPFYDWDEHDPALVERSHEAFREAEAKERSLLGQTPGYAPRLSRYWKRVVRLNHIPLS
jgi:dipeptidase